MSQSNFGLRELSDAEIEMVSGGINGSNKEKEDRLGTGPKPYMESVDTFGLDRFLQDMWNNTPPTGYHFGQMDPSGQHYMIKDGDPNNSLVITPWYQQKIDSQQTNWAGVAADLGIIATGAAGGAAGLVGGINLVLGSAAATVKELWGGQK